MYEEDKKIECKTEAEKQVVFRMREISEYEKITITKQDGKIAVVVSSTLKEVFPE